MAEADAAAVDSVNALLADLAGTADYNAKKLAWLRDRLNQTKEPTLADLLEFRGQALAQAGFSDAAIRDLSALVSEPARATPDNVNKLAQQLLLRATGSDVADGLHLATGIAEDPAVTTEQRFFALELCAQAFVWQGRHDEALAKADEALELHQTPRLKALRAVAAGRGQQEADPQQAGAPNTGFTTLKANHHPLGGFAVHPSDRLATIGHEVLMVMERSA